MTVGPFPISHRMAEESRRPRHSISFKEANPMGWLFYLVSTKSVLVGVTKGPLGKGHVCANLLGVRRLQWGNPINIPHIRQPAGERMPCCRLPISLRPLPTETIPHPVSLSPDSRPGDEEVSSCLWPGWYLPRRVSDVSESPMDLFGSRHRRRGEIPSICHRKSSGVVCRVTAAQSLSTCKVDAFGDRTALCFSFSHTD